MEKYHCALCKHDIEGNLLVYLKHERQEINEIFRKKYPNWNEDQGICPKCKEHFTTWFDKIEK